MSTYNVLSVLITFTLLQYASSQSGILCGVTYFEPTAKGPSTRIVGGTEAKPNSYPWLAGIMKQIAGENVHFCGATLVQVSETTDVSDILITAAHCLDSEPTHVLLGAHSMSKAQPGQQLVRIEKAVSHHGYSDRPVSNDIAVLKLEKPVKFSQTIQPACIPDAGYQVEDKSKGIIAGWGLTQENGDDYPDKLQQAVVPVWNTEDCASKLYKKVDPKTQMCAGYSAGGVDTCSEDSGGPYIFKNSTGRYTVQGIVSYGIGCARANRPGVYTRVSGYVPWIKEQIKILTSVKQ